MNDFYDLFHHYWWLIFPLFGMITGLLSLNQRHDQRLKVLDMIKSYADQGKEPPPELLAVLREPDFGGRAKGGSNWTAVFILGALSAGFVMYPLLAGVGDLRHMAPFLFVALVMGATCLGLLVSMLTRRSD
jgi:hypothetical protein